MSVGFFVFAFADRNGLPNVDYVIAIGAVEVEVGGIEFAALPKAAIDHKSTIGECYDRGILS